MIKRISEKLIRLYKKLVYSIAFIPTIMIIFSLVLGIFMFDLENIGVVKDLKESLHLFLVLGADNARLILTTIIGGIISLTVFSFSMVMVVLNRTSASLSPRVLPQLVAQKFHQVVLGFYMGTIVYSLILVNNVDSDENLPSLGILISMILAILSLGLFIYFIHSISQSIQVDNILKDILRNTREQIETLEKNKKTTNEIHPHDNQSWSGILYSKTGHYNLVNLQALCTTLEKNDLHLTTCIYSGEYVTEGTVLAKMDKPNVEKEITDTIEKSFYLTANADNEQQYYFGLRKMSEIAVKALSPGINDPGTAVSSIHYLTMLFSEISSLGSFIVYTDSKKEARIFQKLPEVDTLLFDCITPIRHFSSNSLEIHTALYNFFQVLLKLQIDKNTDTLKKHLLALIASSDEQITNEYDRKIINSHIEKIETSAIKELFTLPRLS